LDFICPLLLLIHTRNPWKCFVCVGLNAMELLPCSKDWISHVPQGKPQRTGTLSFLVWCMPNSVSNMCRNSVNICWRSG
jgi:hypothetical protein